MAAMAISSSLEDYLEAIAELIAANGHAHSKEIAARMKVKMPSVTNALQALAARDMIHYQPHLPVVLTSRGASVAAAIRHRHAALKNFFEVLLKLETQRADATACKLEHIIGEKELARLVALADAVAGRPDCAPLREYLATAMPEIGNDTEDAMIALNVLPEGRDAVVVRIGENLRAHKKFADLGLVAGAVVTMEGRAPFGDLLRIRLLNSILTLRGGDAAFIWVKLL